MRRSMQDARPAERSSGQGGAPSTPAVPDLPGFDPDDIDPEELREFMAADWVEVKADPGFRERLRRRLWEMIRASHEGDTPDDD